MSDLLAMLFAIGIIFVMVAHFERVRDDIAHLDSHFHTEAEE